MSKRRHDGQEQRPVKRPKQIHPHQSPAIEEIHFARQLQQILSFNQDAIAQLRNGIASFKAFLESVLYRKEEGNYERQLSILHEFLDAEKPADVNQTERPFLSHLWQAYSFAQQNHNDSLESAVSAIFALLVKTLSSLLDFRDHGYLLCHTVLQHQHLRLIKRSLDAPKHKDFLISPCLRLLIEVASFDGGVLARALYKRREQTFDVQTLRRNLALVKTGIPEEELRRRPAIRTLTLRYVLAHLKYLHEGGKVDLLKSRPLCTALFHHLQNDPAEVINELLSVTEQHIFKDNELPRSAKAALLVQHNLERVTEVATRSNEGHASAENCFAWLKAVCTIPSYGILRASGWYPPGTTDMDHEPRNDNMIDLGLDSIDFYDRDLRPDVRNTTLLSWIQTLRPHLNVQERELVLTCFKAALELGAAYFAEKNMQLEPKLTNTWIGYASFLFEVVRLPVPEYLGNEKDWAQLPPQTSIMIESILPRPLTQKVLTRCLNQNSELITFFAVRLLVLAFEKLAETRNQISKGAKVSNDSSQLWHEASDRLLTPFIERCPNMKDVIATFRKIPDDDEHALQREAITKLLQLYYEVTPLQAMQEQFDISAALTTALVRTEVNGAASEVKELRTLELEHLLQIARHGLGMRWFTKQGSLDYSPIMTLLKIHVKSLQSRHIRDLIYHVLSENHVVSSMAACDVLIATLTEINDFVNIGEFLDDCFVRATRKPVKYLDDLEALGRTRKQSGDHNRPVDEPLPSILVAVLLEQAPFVLNKPEIEKQELEAWITSFIELLSQTDERCEILQTIQKSIADLEGFKWTNSSIDPEILLKKVRFPESAPGEAPQPPTSTADDTTIPFVAPPAESENHPELFKWSQKDLDLAVEDGNIASLILCLCSQYPDIRTQALTQLYKLEDSLLKSTLEDRSPVYVLIGELIETYEHHCRPKSEALPYVAGAFVTSALGVQMEPAHFMYPKVNKFLNKGPQWRIHKLPKYWLENTALALPEQDDAYWREMMWVLTWLVDGLRTEIDLEILRKTGVFERVLSLYCSPDAASNKLVREKVMEMLWRATFVDGGSTTLITRTGVLGWLDAVASGEGGLTKALRRRIMETCDVERTEQWSGLRVDEM